MDRPTREEIILEINNGERHKITDADHTFSDGDDDTVSFIHEAVNGSVNINFTYFDATTCIPFGEESATYDFDIEGDHINE